MAMHYESMMTELLSTTSWIGGLVTTLILLGWIAWLRWQARETKRLIEGFEQRFPGECVICSFHAYGVREGFCGGPVHRHTCAKESR